MQSLEERMESWSTASKKEPPPVLWAWKVSHETTATRKWMMICEVVKVVALRLKEEGLNSPFLWRVCIISSWLFTL